VCICACVHVCVYANIYDRYVHLFYVLMENEHVKNRVISTITKI
jgi:hypothetical protein